MRSLGLNAPSGEVCSSTGFRGLGFRGAGFRGAGFSSELGAFGEPPRPKGGGDRAEAGRRARFLELLLL